MPFVIFFSSDVLLRLSCLQISRILLDTLCVFLHACMGSRRMLLPSALERERGRVLFNEGVDKHCISAGSEQRETDKTNFESIFTIRLITTDTLFYITQSLLSAFYDIFITDR